MKNFMAPYRYQTNLKKVFFSGLLFFVFSGFAVLSAQEVQTKIDTTKITIGEQIHFQISVKTDSTTKVHFPKAQNFSPLEVVEAKPTDTTRLENELKLMKAYVLTKFDSGHYVLPTQKILIGKRTVQTDSFLIQVAGVKVDTTKQALYSIKPGIIEPEGFAFPRWGWWVLGGVGVGLLVFLFFYFKKKKEEAKRNIPPYEKAMLSLKELDEGDLLETQDVKTYYSTLVDAARRFLDEKVDEQAMESTSKELIERLQMHKDAGKLLIEQKIIDDFEVILKRTDLIKFARSKPGIITAKEDRGKIEEIINDTKAGIPEPTEEERLKDEVYRIEQLRKKNKKKVFVSIGAGAGLLVVAVAVLFAVKGAQGTKDFLFGNDTKELLKSDWITSTYGTPGVSVATPKVLVRQINDSLPLDVKSFSDNETFASGNAKGDLYIAVSTKKIRKQDNKPPPTQQPDTTSILAHLGVVGARNILIKNEEFSTAEGAHGQKLTGQFSLITEEEEHLSKAYVLVNFVLFGGRQEILVVYTQGDSYAQKIASRVLYSVELKKPGQ